MYDQDHLYDDSGQPKWNRPCPSCGEKSLMLEEVPPDYEPHVECWNCGEYIISNAFHTPNDVLDYLHDPEWGK